MSRHAARVAAMRAVYAMQFSDIQDISSDQIFDTLELDQEDVKYFEEIISGTKLHEKEIDETVDKHIKNWKLERIPKVDLAVLRVAIYELLYKKELSEGVVISEAVRIAKSYSTPKSGKYINGVLSSVYKEIQ